MIRATIALVLAAAAPCMAADLKLKMKAPGGSMANTVYIRGPRQRTELGMSMPGISNVLLLQCDLHRAVMINDSLKAYILMPTDEEEQSAPLAAGAKQGGVITVTTEARDTGERQQMFGYSAHHIIRDITVESTPGACTQASLKMQLDGWYADIAPQLSCHISMRPHSGVQGKSAAACQDKYQSRNTGYVNNGYPLKETTVVKTQANRGFPSTIEVEELSEQELDPSLFEIPKGYREMHNMKEMTDMSTPATPMSHHDHQ